MAIFGFTSCQSEVDDVQGENPNTNANSTTANNLKTSMYDGSFDDFIDASCSSIVLPAISKWQSGYSFSQLDYQQVISILGRLTMTRIQ
jgi:hypothetical protein